jgi:hypothetical protein
VRVQREVRAFAETHGLNADALLDAAENDPKWKDPDWTKQDGSTTKDRYNLYTQNKRTSYDGKPILQWNAPTVRGTRQCYCLVCKRKVTPVGARIVGNRCCGTCPRCRRKVCCLVAAAKTQAKKKKKSA